MIIIGGERPVIEDPEPRFGSLLSSLNNLRRKIEQRQDSSDDQTSANLTYIAQAVGNFIAECGAPVDAHIALTGPVHGETAETIDREKVDNFRTATTNDHLKFVDDAFVTPAGMNAAIKQSVSGFNATDFQQNVRMPFAALHHIDQFDRAAKDPGNPLFFKKAPVTLIMNGDRVIVSPQYPANNAGPYSLYYSDTVKMGSSIGLNEERQISTLYWGAGWNMKGALDNKGRIGIFRPLANKGIYNYASSVPGSGNFFVVLSSTFGDISHKGCLLSASYANNVLSVGHYFFGVNDPESNPTITQIVSSSYKATYNTVNMNNVNDSINKTRTMTLADFFNLGAGVTLTVDLKAGEQPTISADWRYLNLEFLMNISIPVTLTINGKSFKKVFTFTESVHPGKLVIADTGAIDMLKGFSKDRIFTEADLANSKWLVDNDPTNLLNLVKNPGVINNNGLILNGYTTPTCLRIKVSPTDMKGVIPLLENPALSRPVKDSVTQMFVPTRHFSLGEMPERILPLSQDTNQVSYLSYCLAVDRFGYKHKELQWQTGSNTQYDSTSKIYGITRPDLITERDLVTTLPDALCSMSSVTGGVTMSALNFTSRNDYTGYSSFNYAAGAVVLGGKVTLSANSLIVMRLKASEAAKAAVVQQTYNGQQSQYPLSPNMGVFVVNGQRAVCWWSDGCAIVHAAIVPYTLSGNTLTLGLKTDTALTVVSQLTTPTKGNAVSQSNDGLHSRHCDLLAYKVSDNQWVFGLNRPWNDMSGDVTFSTDNFLATTPTLKPIATVPAKAFAGTEFFDVADDHYPLTLIPRVGLFQCTTPIVSDVVLTNVRDTSVTFKPYQLSNQKLVIIPEGYRCVINGVGISVDETHELAYSTWPSYFYLEENTGIIELNRYDAEQKPDNNAIMIGYDNDGTGVRYTRSFIVLDKHLISSTRKGATIPFVENDGSELGATNFFRYKDVIRDT